MEGIGAERLWFILLQDIEQRIAIERPEKAWPRNESNLGTNMVVPRLETRQ